MIQFRCWYCNRAYSVADQRIGERLTCSCKQTLRVPRRSGGNCRVKTPVDWLVEAVVYGGGGAALGFGLGLLILSQFRRFTARGGWLLLVLLPAVGFLAGVIGGERGVNWIGQMIRDRENS